MKIALNQLYSLLIYTFIVITIEVWGSSFAITLIFILVNLIQAIINTSGSHSQLTIVPAHIWLVIYISLVLMRLILEALGILEISIAGNFGATKFEAAASVTRSLGHQVGLKAGWALLAF